MEEGFLDKNEDFFSRIIKPYLKCVASTYKYYIIIVFTNNLGNIVHLTSNLIKKNLCSFRKSDKQQ